MEHAPQLGDRVKLKPWHRYYPCAGTVEKVWPIPHYDIMDQRWFDPDFEPVSTGMKHEREWRVSVKFDVLPDDAWAYEDIEYFLPAVFELDSA